MMKRHYAHMPQGVAQQLRTRGILTSIRANTRPLPQRLEARLARLMRGRRLPEPPGDYGWHEQPSVASGRARWNKP